MNSILFITYYWPPSGKASLHWPLDIIKYLPKGEWKPVVLTVKNDTFTHKEEGMLEQVPDNVKTVRTRSFEPFTLYKKFIGKKEDEQLVASETISTENKSLTHLISIWIRMNLFIPDARVGWYFSAVKSAEEIIKQDKIKAVVSIGPPHSTHLIALRVSRKYKLSHIPVFIDPWVDIAYYKGFKRSKATLSLDNYFEKKVLKNSSHAVFVTDTMKRDYIRKYPFLSEKSEVLYWGYNDQEFKALQPAAKDDSELLIHAGNIFDFQNPAAFWNTLNNEISKGRKLKIKFIGTVSPGIKKSIQSAGLQNNTLYEGYLPYKQMLRELLAADYLLVCATEKRHVPGKLFEYLRAGRPIIAFGDDNTEVADILNKTGSGRLFSYADDASSFFSAGEFKNNMDEIVKFDRKNIAYQFSKMLEKNIK